MSVSTPTLSIARAMQPQELGALAELALQHLRHAGDAGQGRPLERVAHRGEQGLAGLGELAADDEELGVEQVRRLAAAIPMWRPASAMTRLALASPLSARSSRSRMRCMPGSSRKSSSSAGPPARVSRHPRLPHLQIGPVLVDGDVPDLPGFAADPVEDRAIDDERGADVVPDPDVGGDPAAARGSGPRLGKPAEAGLAVGEHRQLDAVAQRIRHRDVLPAAQQTRCRDHARVLVDRSGQGEPDRHEVADRGADGLGHVAEQQRGAVQLAVVAVVERQRRVVLGDDGPADIGDGDPEVPGGEVEPGDEADPSREGDLDGAAPAAGGRRRAARRRGRRAP